MDGWMDGCMYVCMYVCMYIVYIYAPIYICTYPWTLEVCIISNSSPFAFFKRLFGHNFYVLLGSGHRCMCVYIHTFACVYVYIYIYIEMCIYILAGQPNLVTAVYVLFGVLSRLYLVRISWFILPRNQLPI